MKLRKHITRRRLKWAGSVGIALVLVVLVGSMWLHLTIAFNSPTTRRVAHLANGRMECFVASLQGDEDVGVFYWEGFLDDRFPFSNRRGVRIERSPFRERLRWGFGPGWRIDLAIFRYGPRSYSKAALPLWLPLLILTALTIHLWRTDRRAKEWQCAKCRYDLRGLPDGVCPECGSAKGEG